MIDKFSTGYTYLAKVGKGWYIVQQVSMKGWVATLFTHTCNDSFEDERHFKGNGVSLFNEMEKANEDEMTVFKFTQNKTLREAMFDILKYGEWKSL